MACAGGKNMMLWGLLLLGALFPPFSQSTEELGPLSSYRPVLDEEFIQLLREVDLERAEVMFMRKCSSCHDHEREGGHGKGPHLWNVMGRKAGSIAGFEFSEAMRSSGHTWDFATLNYYLTRTDRAVPGLAMEFRGLRRAKDRAALIAFLRTLHDNPLDLP
jgi:cytochrome c